MGATETITIDGREVRCSPGISILQAADEAGIYIPRLCSHPDLAPGPGTPASARVYRHGEAISDGAPDATYIGCGLCAVEIKGNGPALACATSVEGGMIIDTASQAVREIRRDRLARMLARHPHACLLCAEREGCDREECTQGVGAAERCCAKFGDCEFQKVCAYVTIRQDVSQYVSREIPVVETALFAMNPNLCVGCIRCVRACEKAHGTRVISFVLRHAETVVGTVGPTYRESGCVFCGACVSVCPSGALMDKGLPWKRKELIGFRPVRLPPEECLAFTEENVARAPEENGVVQLFDDERNVIYIRGADNMRKALRERLGSVPNAAFFRCERHAMYTMRETELLEVFLKKHGKLPEINDEIAGLY